MEADQLETRISEVVREIADIKAQIGSAKAYMCEHGKFHDPKWYQKAMSALRYKGIEHQDLLRKKSNAKKEARKLYDSQFERKFIEIAKTRLSSETFSMLVSETRLHVPDLE